MARALGRWRVTPLAVEFLATLEFGLLPGIPSRFGPSCSRAPRDRVDQAFGMPSAARNRRRSLRPRDSAGGVDLGPGAALVDFSIETLILFKADGGKGCAARRS